MIIQAELVYCLKSTTTPFCKMYIFTEKTQKFKVVVTYLMNKTFKNCLIYLFILNSKRNL